MPLTTACADYIIAVLRFLSVRHLAVIDTLELEFEPGLSVLTGETGAGKSILVGAVGLLVGGRASSDLVRTGEETASVEAIFEAPDGRETIVRREVSAQGRSRATIDGALATSAALRDLGAGSSICTASMSTSCSSIRRPTWICWTNLPAPPPNAPPSRPHSRTGWRSAPNASAS